MKHNFLNCRTMEPTPGAGGAEDKRTETELLAKIDEKINTGLQSRATKAELEKIRDEIKTEYKDLPIEALRSLADDKTGVMSKVIAQGLEIERLKTEATRGNVDLSFRGQAKAFLERNKDTIKQIRSGQRQAVANLEPFEVVPDYAKRAAAASPMLPSTVAPGGTAYINRFEIQSGINELLRPEPTYWDFLPKGNTNSETYIWLNKRPTDGAAGFIGPGQYKPALSFTVNTELSNAKKIAANEKMAIELLEDIDGFQSWVETELVYQVTQKTNDTLQGAGAGDSVTPEGIQHMSTAYDANTGVATTNPNFWDAIKAGVTMLRVKRFKGVIVAFVNPVDYANALLQKAISQGQLFIPPATGATIIEDLNMPLGQIQFIAVQYQKTLVYKPFRMTWGLENDDFTKNLVTVLGEHRFHQFHSQNHDGFAIYDSLANITAAITKV